MGSDIPDQINNPDFINFNVHMESLFGGSSKEIEETLHSLSKVIQDLIFYRAWDLKGRIHGIHFDFGRHSYMRTHEIPEYYWMSDEERVNLLLFIQERMQF